MDTAWRAAHPGEEPGPGAWPPYVCQDTPTPPPLPGGGNGGDSNSGNTAPGRDHQYEGFDRGPSQYQQDMDLGPLGSPRTGLAERMNTPGDNTAATDGAGGGAPRATDTARSNVPTVTPWATPRQDTITDGDGNPRRVRVIDTDAGPAVIDDDGVATGEILTTSTTSTDTTNSAGGGSSVRRVEGLAGVNLTDQTGRDDEENASTSSTTGSPRSTELSEPAESSQPSEAAGAGGTAGSTGDGDDGGTPVPAGPAGPLGAGGAAAGGVGALLAQRGARSARGRRRDGSHRADIDWGGGREQSLILLEGPNSPREHRFDMDVPEGGQMVKNPDGSVDVLDADGNTVEHVKAPWAYDASGRPVETYYEVDNDTGELVQVIDPQHTTALPILADPDKQDTSGGSGSKDTEDLSDSPAARAQDAVIEANTPPADSNQNSPQPDPEQQRQDNNDFSRAANGNQNPADVGGDADKEMLGAIDITDREEGVPWTEDLGNGEEAERVIVPGTGRQTVDSRVTGGPNGNNDIRTTANDLDGVDIWSQEEEGGGSYAQIDNGNDRLTTQRFDQTPAAGEAATPSVTSEANADNSQGTVAARNPDGTQSYGNYQRTGDNQYEMDVQNPDDTTSEVLSTQREDAGVSTQVTDQHGPRVSTDGGTPVSLDDAGNDISQNGEPDPSTGRFYDPETGEWVNGAVLGGIPVHRGQNGNLTDPEGNPVSVERNEYGRFEASDAGAAAYDVGTELPIDGRIQELRADEAAGRISPDDAAEQIRALERAGKVLGPVGTGLGIAGDIQSGEDPGKAVATNLAGAGGGTLAGMGTYALIGAGAAVAGLTAPAWGTAAAVAVVSTGASWAVTEGAKNIWDWFAD